MKPRRWIVALALMLPETLSWLAAWVINRECDRIEREMRKLATILEGLARGAWEAHQRREQRSAVAASHAAYYAAMQGPGGLMPYHSPLSGYLNSPYGQSSLNSMIGNLLGNNWIR